MITELRRTSDPPRNQILEFDNACQQLLLNFGAVKVEKVEPSLSYVHFPSPNEPLYGTGEARDEFWQNRPFQEIGIHAFDCGFIAPEYAGFVDHNTLTIWPHTRPTADFTSISFDPIGPIEIVCMSGQATFLLSKMAVLIIPFNRFEPAQRLGLPGKGAGTMAPFGDGVVIGFPTSQILVTVSADGDLRSIPVRFRGVRAVAGFDEFLICGVTNSCVIRRVTVSGHEAGAFVGHCGAVTGIEKLSEKTFTSYGEDDTVRVWDADQEALLATIVLGHVNLVGIAGSSDFVVCGLQSRRIAVADIRRRGPALGVQTQEFLPNRMSFCQESDTLFVFAVQEVDPSFMFAESDRREPKRNVFRTYKRFTAEKRTAGILTRSESKRKA
jgi:hypothetical protein